jgi:hypothetical protein
MFIVKNALLKISTETLHTLLKIFTETLHALLKIFSETLAGAENFLITNSALPFKARKSKHLKI